MVQYENLLTVFKSFIAPPGANKGCKNIWKKVVNFALSFFSELNSLFIIVLFSQKMRYEVAVMLFLFVSVLIALKLNNSLFNFKKYRTLPQMKVNQMISKHRKKKFGDSKIICLEYLLEYLLEINIALGKTT